MFITNRIKKLVKSLHLKKNRYKHKLFIVEGEKIINLLLQSSYKIVYAIVSQKFKNIEFFKNRSSVYFTNELKISQLSFLKTNIFGIAIVEMQFFLDFTFHDQELIVALDGISDPGNLGTIIRILDWYNIKKLLCSQNTVDFYNPKTVQASMGSFLNIQYKYCNLEEQFKSIKKEIYGGYLEGRSIHKVNFPSSGILVIGNESNGISKNLEKYIKKVTIPRYGKAESLNAAIATAIICDKWKNSQ